MRTFVLAAMAAAAVALVLAPGEASAKKRHHAAAKTPSCTEQSMKLYPGASREETRVAWIGTKCLAAK